MSEPSVSLIVPVFNVQDVILDTLTSIAQQTLDDYEVIVVDDASTDNTCAIVQEFVKKDLRFRLMCINRRSGTSVARNQGMEIATGDYIYFADGDDKITPSALEVLYNAAQRDCVDIVRGSHWLWYPGERPALRVNIIEEMSHAQVRNFKYSQSPSAVFAYSAWNTLFRRELLHQNDAKFDCRLIFGEDRLFNLSIFPKARGITYLKERTYFWRRNRPTSVTQVLINQKVAAPHREYLTTIQTTLDCLDNNFEDLPDHKLWLRASLLLDLLNYFLRGVTDWHKLPSSERTTALDLLNRLEVPPDLLKLPFVKGTRSDIIDRYVEFHNSYYNHRDISRALFHLR